MTNMGSIIGYRIDYNGVGVWRGQRHIPMWGGSVIWQGPLIFYNSRVCVCAVCCLLAFSTAAAAVALFLLAAPPHPSLVGKYLPPQFFH